MKNFLALRNDSSDQKSYLLNKKIYNFEKIKEIMGPSLVPSNNHSSSNEMDKRCISSNIVN